MVHPVLAVRRDRRGRLLELAEGDRTNGPVPPRIVAAHCRSTASATRRGCAELESEDRAHAQRRAGCGRRLARRCASVPSKSRRKSRVARRPTGAAAKRREIKALLEWMDDNHFTFLGYRQYRLRRGRSEDVLEPLPETGLGILRVRRGHIERADGAHRRSARARAQPDLLTITKANSMSTVHRATYLDYVGIKTFDSAGRVTGEQRFLGLFTSAVYNRSPREIPLLRHKIDSAWSRTSALDPASHDGKAVVHVIETYPRDELFQSSVAELIRIVRGIVNLYERQRVRVFVRRDTFGRFYSCLIYVPRDRYNTQVRQRIEASSCAAAAATGDRVAGAALGFRARARAHDHPRADATARARRSMPTRSNAHRRETVRTWEDRLRAALIETRGELEGRLLADRLRERCSRRPTEEDVAIPVALEDISELDESSPIADRIAMRLAPDPAASGESIHLRLFRSAAPIPLSQALPMLENMGFVVLSEHPYRIDVRRQPPIWLQDFEMQRRDGGTVELRGARTAVQGGVPRRLERRERRTTASTGCASCASHERRQTVVLRAYCRYLLQTGMPFSQAYMEHVLASNAAIASVLSRLFEAQFDPALKAPQRAGAS